ncbi:outer membrane protein [Bradyrhizobium neotropicale]|uniref:Outer membrane protein beta-barrel domain-containing protein n=1 Tax=Bradyrhizobium neotropicale TaxID=1497615 RepID=A0A176YXQ2_9BRAD|nr:outer membrane beta-barrel protein [Bradyrhizobium neotropicale]OAF11565.1 hypothetical protein AXW67_22370 [Bradyrhizobium neotropicale]
MIRMLLRTIFVSPFLLGAGAHAADLALKAPPRAIVTAPPWTGWYVGLNAGGNWGRSGGDTFYSCSDPDGVGCYSSAAYSVAINNLGAGQRFDTAGFTGGIQGGYNWQAGNWLLGLEADLDYFRSAGSRTVTAAAPFSNGTLSLTSSISTDWLFTFRPRVGVVVSNWLFYGTGGLAVSQLNGRWSFVHSNPFGPFTESASASAVKAGWTVGAGFETMLADRWTVGAEYLYVKFDGVSATGNLVTPAALPRNDAFNHNADLSANIVRLRLNKIF